jgi:hypothetical protein
MAFTCMLSDCVSTLSSIAEANALSSVRVCRDVWPLISCKSSLIVHAVLTFWVRLRPAVVSEATWRLLNSSSKQEYSSVHPVKAVSHITSSGQIRSGLKAFKCLSILLVKQILQPSERCVYDC